MFIDPGPALKTLKAPLGAECENLWQTLTRDIKADSSNFINKKKWVRGRFSWQEGYGAFSYGHSQLDTIIRYIQNQEQHHRRRSFKDEYLTWLKKFEIPFEEKYVFQFME